jgi:heme-degrading monooxygenase HmoA
MTTPYVPPYYAVIFISKLADDTAGYAQTAEHMLQLAADMPGFLGFESARESVGISVSFWRDQASIRHWQQQAQHLNAQAEGRRRWYDAYELHVARVERFTAYQQPADPAPETGTE